MRLLAKRGHEGVGLTLSEARARIVRERGFERVVWDITTITVKEEFQMEQSKELYLDLIKKALSFTLWDEPPILIILGRPIQVLKLKDFLLCLFRRFLNGETSNL